MIEPSMINSDTLEKLIKGPIILLLGQNYLSMGVSDNNFLKQILKKYSSTPSDYESNYDSLLKLGLEKNIDEVSSWIGKLAQFIHASPQITRIVSIPWSSVFTSAIDPIVDTLFDTDWRTVQIVCDDNYRITDPRNKMNLHITKLYGCLSRNIKSHQAPLTNLEKGKRQFVSTTLLKRIPEIVTTKGLLVIEGYQLNDWLSFENSLYPTLSQLSSGQILFCSVSKDLKANEFFKDLVDNGKIIPFENSFAEVIDDLESSGAYKITTPDYEERFAKYINIDGKKVKVPKELYRNVSKSAIILDDELFEGRKYETEDEKYVQFKDFLSKTTIRSLWPGYPKGFAFKRDYYEKLKSLVKEKLKFNSEKNSPIILHGQSGGGKTVSLGNLAYELFQEYQLPVLFIEKQYHKIEEQQIDNFCLWAQEKGARGTIIIWDGMIEIDFYYNLLNRLEARGRNIVIVGSTYTLKKSRFNTIPSLANLNDAEKMRFKLFIKGIDNLLANLIDDDEVNILAMFYRHLPDSRSKIQKGLRSEFEHFRELIKGYNLSESSQIENKPTMFHLLEKAGLLNDEKIFDENIDFETEDEIDGERVSLADKLIYSVMVPGQFGIEVPFELLIRNLGFTMVASTPFRLLNMINIITWIEDNVGNISLGPRTPIEAQILVRYLGNKRTQVEFIKSLLSSVTCKDEMLEGIGFESNRDIQFAVDLLYNISPNGPDNAVIYNEFYYDITEILRQLREGNLAYHPRLILKEASFLREIIRGNWKKGDESSQDLLNRAEDIVREALDKLTDAEDMVIRSYLTVELASIIGSKTLEFIGEQDSSSAIECYNAVLSISSPSFASNPDNYSALDVLSWTTIGILRSKLLNDEQRKEAQVALLNIFELSEAEGVSIQNYDDFNKRKLTLFEIMGLDKLSDALFERLANEGSTTGFFIRTINILNESKDDTITTNKMIEKYASAYNYLQQFESKFSNDGRCLFLLFRCWWVMSAKTQPLSGEKKTVPLSLEQWEYCLSLTEKILSCNGFENIAVVLYIKGLSEFHLGLMNEMSYTFRKLESLTDFSSYGNRRIKKSYLSSTKSGIARTYSGDVVANYSTVGGKRFGELYINELKINVRFSLYEFKEENYKKGQTLNNFRIGFNFRGPLAVFNNHD